MGANVVNKNQALTKLSFLAESDDCFSDELILSIVIQYGASLDREWRDWRKDLADDFEQIAPSTEAVGRIAQLIRARAPMEI